MTVPDETVGPRPPDGTGARRRLWLAGAGTVAALAVSVIVIQALRGAPAGPSGYDDGVAERFLAVCGAQAADLGFSAPDAFCRCSYDRIELEVPFDRFVEIDARIQQDPGAVPDEIDRIRTECFVGTAGVPATTTPSATTAAHAGA